MRPCAHPRSKKGQHPLCIESNLNGVIATTMAENKREGDDLGGRTFKRQHDSQVRSYGIESESSCSFYTEDALREPVIMIDNDTGGSRRVGSEPFYKTATDRIIPWLPRTPSPTPEKEFYLDKEETYQTLMDDHFTCFHPYPEGEENEFVSVVFVYPNTEADSDVEDDYTKRLFYIPRALMDYIYKKGKVIEFNGITLPKEDQVWRYFTADNEEDRKAALTTLTPENKLLVGKVLRMFSETGVLLRPFLRIEMDDD